MKILHFKLNSTFYSSSHNHSFEQLDIKSIHFCCEIQRQTADKYLIKFQIIVYFVIAHAILLFYVLVHSILTSLQSFTVILVSHALRICNKMQFTWTFSRLSAIHSASVNCQTNVVHYVEWCFKQRHYQFSFVFDRRAFVCCCACKIVTVQKTKILVLRCNIVQRMFLMV